MSNQIPEFSTEEKKIWDMLVEVQKTFLHLPDLHPTVIVEMTLSVHKLQSLLEHRLLKRIYPNHFS